jgi:type VI secretion system ImpM family protein
MFGFFKKKQPVLEFKNIRAFGKLPGFADFLRYRSADTVAIKVDAWLTQGLSSLMQQGKQGLLESEWDVSLCEKSENTYTLVRVISSKDKSGRHYPFVLIAEVENSWLKDYPSSLPGLFQDLYHLAKRLQGPDINSQQILIDSLLAFEKKSLLLSKREVLEDRIRALKLLTQDEAWGHWAKQQEGMDLCGWKASRVADLRKKSKIELPMSSTQSVSEATYWLQLMEDLCDMREGPLNYYWISSESIKKILIDSEPSKTPTFQSLFKPYATGLHEPKAPDNLVYEGSISLLSSVYYWKQVSP